MTKCRICHAEDDHPVIRAKEVMLGTRREFDYFKCTSCGCLQIATIPADLAEYYPENYLSFKNYKKILKNKIRMVLDQKRVKHALVKPNWIGALSRWVAKPLNYLEWMSRTHCKIDDNILDVGCGNGKILLRMSIGGVKHCEGLDPYVKETTTYSNGLKIYQSDIHEFADKTTKKYKLIMLHHALEHMTDVHDVMKSILKLLDPTGSVLIRIPVVDSLAWEMFRESWGNLDAPRHIHIFNHKSLQILLQQFGLEIYHADYESNPAQFVWSDIYKRGYVYTDKITPKQVLGNEKLKEYKRLSKQIETTGQADCACFYARLATPG